MARVAMDSSSSVVVESQHSLEQEKQNIFPDYDPCKQWPAVCYVLDEADIHFGADQVAGSSEY